MRSATISVRMRVVRAQSYIAGLKYGSLAAYCLNDLMFVCGNTQTVTCVAQYSHDQSGVLPSLRTAFSCASFALANNWSRDLQYVQYA